MANQLPILYVEGFDDVCVISALLKRHGIDTDRGNAHLRIISLYSVSEVIDAIPNAIRANLIKAEVHTWMAWQRVPGSTLGAAVNSKILGCDSPQALGLLEWLKSLYGF